MRGKVQAATPKEIYDEILTAQRALVEARGQLLEAQTPAQFAQVLACLHRSSGHVERAIKACARACDESDGTHG